ncbi:hypothetical protein BGX28_006609 [Mortierella sp. GBA30]|nr:hypothetical protein BGX28_006609 [Mortierella sp. GBA30]
MLSSLDEYIADLTVTAPTATSFVTAGGTLNIAWTYSGQQPPVPPTISVELVDNSKKLFTGPLALFSNLPTSAGSASWPIPKLGFVGSSFSVILVANTNNVATIYAQGPTFSIQPEGTPAPANPSGGDGSNGAHGSATMLRWNMTGQAIAIVAAIALFWMSF